MTRQTMTVDEAFDFAADLYLAGRLDEQVDSFDEDMQGTLARLLAPWNVDVVEE